MDNLTDKQNKDIDELSIWDLATLVCKNWLLIVIITGMALIFGIIFSFVFEDQGQTTYYISENTENIFIDRYNYYPNDFEGLYKTSLKEYLELKTDASKIPSITFKTRTVYKDLYTQMLYIRYPSTVSKNDAELMNEYIIQWHNMSMDTELERLINLKGLELDQVSADYQDKQNAYYAFLNNDGGYYDVENTMHRYTSLFEAYKSQLFYTNTVLEKINNGTPLTQDELLTYGNSSDLLTNQINTLNDQINDYEELLTDISNTFREMAFEESILRTAVDSSLQTCETKNLELETLNYELINISQYYIDGFKILSTTISTWKMNIIVSVIIGFVLSIIVIFLKISLFNYLSKRNQKAA